MKDNYTDQDFKDGKIRYIPCNPNYYELMEKIKEKVFADIDNIKIKNKFLHYASASINPTFYEKIDLNGLINKFDTIFKETKNT